MRSFRYFVVEIEQPQHVDLFAQAIPPVRLHGRIRLQFTPNLDALLPPSASKLPYRLRIDPQFRSPARSENLLYP